MRVVVLEGLGVGGSVGLYCGLGLSSTFLSSTPAGAPVQTCQKGISRLFTAASAPATWHPDGTMSSRDVLLMISIMMILR